MNIKSSSARINGLTWSMASSTKEGELKCGDACLVKEYDDQILLAVIDGLGHGDKAANASQKAVELLKTFSGESLIKMINHCHEGLRNTRGVVMSLALINLLEHTITWLGVGNVDGTLLLANEENRPKVERFLLKGGIVGYQLPFLQATITPISKGDMIIFSTDGVEISFLGKIDVNDEPDYIVTKISENYFMQSDDALILVAKYEGR